MNTRVATSLALIILVVLTGCAGVDDDDYQDAPDEIKDGSLDYQDYKEAGCPYLGDSLDQKTMEKCNEWIRKQANSTTTTS